MRWFARPTRCSRRDTPFGAPSDDLLSGTLGGVKMVFLPRHGRGHVHTPTTVPYRANIFAMKAMGVTDLVAVSAVGSLKEAYAPGDFLIVDQYIDRTFAREKSFFAPGLVGHVPFAHPTCARLSALCAGAARDLGLTVHEGGTYVAMEGPQFSTLAESRLYRSWGADVIGMTAMLRFHSAAYGFALIWAYAGILFRHFSASGFAGAYPAAGAAAAACILLFLGGMVYLVRKRSV